MNDAWVYPETVEELNGWIEADRVEAIQAKFRTPWDTWDPAPIRTIGSPQFRDVEYRVKLKGKTMNDLNKAYLQLQNACSIKVGDKVKVLRKATSDEMGWPNSWAEKYMDATVGLEGVVEDVDDNGIQVKFAGVDMWRYPFFVLERIGPTSINVLLTAEAPHSQAIVHPGESVTVGCTTLNAIDINAIIKAWNARP